MTENLCNEIFHVHQVGGLLDQLEGRRTLDPQAEHSLASIRAR